MTARWSDTVEDYNPVIPRPRWGYDKPPHALITRVLESARPSIEESLLELGRHREIIYSVPIDADTRSAQAHWNNGWFSCLDAAALVAFLSARRPQRYIEIGSGNSTLFARHAIQYGRLGTTITSIDPQPRAQIDAICDEVVRMPLEDCDLTVFSKMESGDILFFDGSHRVFTNSDVTVLFFDILPRLKPGILVHLHDIFLPSDYPAVWNGRLYSEQYLLGAMLLCGNAPFKTILPNYFVCNDFRLGTQVKRIFDGRPGTPVPFYYNTGVEMPGVSFWLETI